MVHISAVFCTFCIVFFTGYYILFIRRSVCVNSSCGLKKGEIDLSVLCRGENKYISSETFLVCNVMTKYNFFLNGSGNHVGQ